MHITKHLPLNLTVLALAAVLWQAEVQARSSQANEAGPRSKGVGNRDKKGRAGVRKRRQLRIRRLSRMRERARLYEPYIAAAARRHGVDPRALWTIAFLETRFRPELVSPVNARGLMQFMPGTARRFKLKNPHDGPAAIDAAARYVKQLAEQFGGRLDLVLAGYNAGEGAVDCYRTGRSLRTSTGKIINPRGIKTSGVPPYRETLSYVKRGLLVYNRLTSAGVFNPELIAEVRLLQAPSMNIALSDQRLIENELRELGGMPATMLFSGGTQIGVSQSFGNQVAVARNADGVRAAAAEVDTVFFDVHSGTRYLVRKGSIVNPIDSVETVESPSVMEVSRHVVAKSFYVGAGRD